MEAKLYQTSQLSHWTLFSVEADHFKIYLGKILKKKMLGEMRFLPKH